ncbi:MAG: MFS transporter [Deltaproteobacteria bacterium]
MDSGSAETSGGRFGVHAEQNLRRFLIGYTTSLVGSAMVPVALSFAVLNEGRPARDVGYVLAADTVPLVLLLLLGGVVADRVARRVSMLGSDVVRFASEGVLAGLLLTGTPPLWALIGLAGVLGVGQAFFNPAMTGLMPELVMPDRLQRANALRGVATSSAQILGPSLAGVIVATGGPGWAIAIDSASFAVSAGCLFGLNIPPRTRGQRASMLAQLTDGWTAFRSRTWLWTIVVQFATFNAFSFAPFMVLGAVVAHDRLGGAAAWGVILAVFGAGSIIGGLAATRIHSQRPLVVATLGASVFAAPVALIAIPAPTALIAIGAGLAGIGLSIFGALWETALQQHVPNEVLSRVSAYDWFGSVAFVPLGYILAAPLAGAVGTRTTLLVAAGWAAASCAAVLSTPAVRHLQPFTPQRSEEHTI